MSSLKIRVVTRSALFLLLFLWSAAAVAPQSDIVIEKVARSPKNILDLRIEKINLTHVTMEAALSKIEDAVNADVHDRPYLSIGIGFSREAEYGQKRIPEEQWKHRNPKVELHATHTTLRQVFDSLCAQSKWSYVQAEPGIVFIDDRSYFKNQ